MFEGLSKLVKKFTGKETKQISSKSAAKERLHLVLMQDRANVSADFLELMKQEIIEVIKKYIEVEEDAIDVRLKNKTEADGSNGAPFLYANIPVFNIKTELTRNVGDKKKDTKAANTEGQKPKAKGNTQKNTNNTKKETAKKEGAKANTEVEPKTKKEESKPTEPKVVEGHKDSAKKAQIKEEAKTEAKKEETPESETKKEVKKPAANTKTPEKKTNLKASKNASAKSKVKTQK